MKSVAGRWRQTHGDERLEIGERFVLTSPTFLELWFPRWAAKRRRKWALERYGWDFRCCGCDRWVHADECAKTVAETSWHWHYRCDCGAMNHIFLGAMIAMRDDGQWGGAEAFANGPFLAGGNA